MDSLLLEGEFYFIAMVTIQSITLEWYSQGWSSATGFHNAKPAHLWLLGGSQQ